MRDKTQINKRVQARYDFLMEEGKHGHYETMFKCVHEELALQHAQGFKAGQEAMRERAADYIDNYENELKDVLVSEKMEMKERYIRACSIRALPIEEPQS
ncbi:hypothetical protein AMC83_CH01910 [Rhizobium phaseoli]|uniref:hypothetical protein n=1 Tax=Rhizobium phaseoli TaxID=396 RepID=UPI0007EA7F4F|nr:hypothetical protein [Rhizobium phaseoli]ANL71893.1 hypothetical protein AMC83_CH01910 [Rhizobium phaseoli]